MLLMILLGFCKHTICFGWGILEKNLAIIFLVVSFDILFEIINIRFFHYLVCSGIILFSVMIQFPH